MVSGGVGLRAAGREAPWKGDLWEESDGGTGGLG